MSYQSLCLLISCIHWLPQDVLVSYVPSIYVVAYQWYHWLPWPYHWEQCEIRMLESNPSNRCCVPTATQLLTLSRLPCHHQEGNMMMLNKVPWTFQWFQILFKNNIILSYMHSDTQEIISISIMTVYWPDSFGRVSKDARKVLLAFRWL